MKQLIDKYPEYKDELNKYQITSNFYETYKQSEIKDLETIIQSLNKLLINDNNNINNMEERLLCTTF